MCFDKTNCFNYLLKQLPKPLIIAPIITYVGQAIPNLIGPKKQIIIPGIKNNDETPKIFKNIITFLTSLLLA